MIGFRIAAVGRAHQLGPLQFPIRRQATIPYTPQLTKTLHDDPALFSAGCNEGAAGYVSNAN
jgi:hypothetical protein